MIDPGHVIAGKYEIERALGEGGMGAVFVAKNRALEKRVALKWMRPELASNPDHVARFMRAALGALHTELESHDS